MTLERNFKIANEKPGSARNVKDLELEVKKSYQMYHKWTQCSCAGVEDEA